MMISTERRSSLPRVFALSVALAVAAPAAQAADLLTHVHGLSYSTDGKRLMIPSHHGLAIYEAGKWAKAPGPQHDYMGFSATATVLYSSGHPAPGSRLVNPFGLIRSRDGGKTWDRLGLEGESDFHLLATGWNTNAVYVWNAAPNSRMREKGLHYTLNDGILWKPAKAARLDGDPRALAAHPDDPAIVAVATQRGVFISKDSGGGFSALAMGSEAYAVFFELDGKHLWYGSFDSRARLSRVAITGGVAAEIALPPLGRDAVAYIAQNPAARSEFAISTFNRNVYLTNDGGRAWKQIAARGQSK
jgi:photosystem II stability/assembly factor-like uncharacterized protein